MIKLKKKRVNVSKISHVNDRHVFWYDVDGANRHVVRGTLKFVTEERDALIERFKNDTLIVRK